MTHRYAIAEFRTVDQALNDYYRALMEVATQVRLHRDTTSSIEILNERRQDLREAIAALHLTEEPKPPNPLELQL